MTFKNVVQQAKQSIREVSVEEVRGLLSTNSVLVDVRQYDESIEGTIEGAHTIPRGLLELELPQQIPSKDTPLIFFCAAGNRSVLAALAAQHLGYTDVVSLAGGFGQWKQAGAPFHMPALPEPAHDPEIGAESLAALPCVSSPAKSLASALNSAQPPVVFDIREAHETAKGHIPGAVLEPRGFLDARIEKAVRDKAQPIVLVSSQGVRARLAVQELTALGYTNLQVLEGGFQAWLQADLAITTPQRLSASDRLRYSRHLLIPEVGEAGQLALLSSRVLLIGAGGLGSPAAFYLAAAGVGTLGVVDSDVVDRSNLQRQILHTDARVGIPKVESAQQTLHALNPNTTIHTYATRLTSANAMQIIEGYDLVIDGGDNFPTRYLINDACVQLGIPLVHGSVYRFEGQVTVFHPGVGPCYRCLYPEPPPPELAPSCAEAGVLGVVPGIIGLLQASETIKVLLDVGEPLVGRLLHFDALGTNFRTLKLGRDPECAVCGENAEWSGFIDYVQFCNAD